METLTLIWHCDPGHEWIQVPMALIEALGVKNAITKYSFHDGRGTAYLEGDCDAETFLTAYEKANLAPIKFEHKEHANFPGRRFTRFNGTQTA